MFVQKTIDISLIGLIDLIDLIDVIEETRQSRMFGPQSAILPLWHESRRPKTKLTRCKVHDRMTPGRLHHTSLGVRWRDWHVSSLGRLAARSILRHSVNNIAQMLRVPGSKTKILQVLHLLAVFGLCVLRDTLGARRISRFCTANTAFLAVLWGSILWNAVALGVFWGSILWNTVCT